MTNDPTDWLAKYQAEQEKRRAELPAIKRKPLADFARRGLITVPTEYNDEGACGQIEGIIAYAGKTQRLGETPARSPPLRRRD